MKYRILSIFAAIILATADITVQSVVAGSGGQNSVGETYIISIFSRRFTFSQPMRVIAVLDAVGDLNFIADEL